VPPLAVKDELYGEPTFPVLVAQITVIAGGLILIEQLELVVDAWPLVESVTVTVKLNVPAVVGVPVTAPVEGFNVRPGGSEPVVIANVYGGAPPVATNDEL
jgi:hypothetical protein